MATKAEIIEQLTVAGIDHDPDVLKADLEALLPNVPTVSRESPEPEAVLIAVGIYDSHGHPHRTYSRALHGDNFMELAAEFISQRPGWTMR